MPYPHAVPSIQASSTSPVWMTYRAIGSGGGETEIIGKPLDTNPVTYADPVTEFGCSDVAMTNSK